MSLSLSSKVNSRMQFLAKAPMLAVCISLLLTSVAFAQQQVTPQSSLQNAEESNLQNAEARAASGPGSHRCVMSGGKVITAVPQFDTESVVLGTPISICRFKEDTQLAYVGLTTLDAKPSIAATVAFIKIDPNKPWKLPPQVNPGPALCSLLGGSSIAEYSNGGISTPTDGEVDMCYFGDGSSIGGNTLVYTLLGTEHSVKQAIQSKPLNITLPAIQ
ncbi:hypothetical protein EO087_04955 [Dyella sp. M7H15-1]|uniref:hypothetical protein n=1 Tax=Dyella sp. M7H15-1 TaxID=2501295 RepID=UPI001004FD40|nr:hypothetical protein [Dyella sp. M7H15-1]QAU23409.1 hypothetical protein EO087_04955 [Dyella sp. M7H15-1]